MILYVWCNHTHDMTQQLMFHFRCRYLIKFLAKLAEKEDVNKMSPSNIAIVIGPNLIWAPGDGG